jgi:large subunit ribosomal protein L25
MELKLTAQSREPQEKLSPDFVPAVLYGKGVVNKNLKVKKIDFEKAFAKAGESNLIELDLGGSAAKVLVKDYQKDAIKGFFTHVDFYQVNMKEKITAEIPLHFVGESKAIKELGGALIKDMDTLEVECLPGDLVDHIDVDISVLRTYDDAIRVNDLPLAEGLVLVHHTSEVVAAVMAPKVEEEPVAPAVEAAAAAGETVVPGAEAKAGEAKKEEGKK